MDGVLTGIAVAAQPVNIAFCFLGVLMGTLVGVLPGIGPIATISLLLPLTAQLDPAAAVIMVSGIYYGAAYGGSTTSILVRIPGEAATVVTCIDGHAMAQQGRAGTALAMAAIGSFVAGTVGTVGIGLLSEPIMRHAVRLGPPEYFALMLLGVLMVIFFSSGAIVKSLAMVVLGLFLSQIGQDIVTGEARFTGGSLELIDGIDLVPLAMGLFGISEVLLNLEGPARATPAPLPWSRLMPSREEWRESAGPIARGSLMGFFLGLIPGGGPTLASFASYAAERALSRKPETFGHGALAGVAGPESANNSAASGSFIPLLTLGIPGNAVMALILGAMILHGVSPGPMLMQERPEVFWGVVVSMYLGNLMLLILNLPLIGLWVQLLRLPYRLLFPAILLLTLVGTYATTRSVFDLLVLIGSGLAGYLLRKLGYELAPLILAFVLGGQLEQTFRQSVLMGGGSLGIFVERPAALILLLVGALFIIVPLSGAVNRSRLRVSAAE